MTISYVVNEEHNAVAVICTGKVTDQEFLDHRPQLEADTRVKPAYLLIVDTTEIETIEITPASFKKDALADSTYPKRQGVRAAIVATKAVVYGLGRMFQTFHDEGPQEVRIFHTLAEAEEWLGVTMAVIMASPAQD